MLAIDLQTAPILRLISGRQRITATGSRCREVGVLIAMILRKECLLCQVLRSIIIDEGVEAI